MNSKSGFLFLFVFSAIIFFSSCKQDNYLDWKYLNKQWLEENSKKDPNFKETESGIQYKVKFESGLEKPTIGSNKYYVEFECKGWYVTGENDVFQPKANIRGHLKDYVVGLQEVMKMMKIQDTYEVCIPYELGYGAKKSGTIPPYTTLIFEITLKNVQTD